MKKITKVKFICKRCGAGLIQHSLKLIECPICDREIVIELDTL